MANSGFNVRIDLTGKILTEDVGRQLWRALYLETELVTSQLEDEVAGDMPVGETAHARTGVRHRAKVKPGLILGEVYETGPAIRYIEVIEQGRRPNKPISREGVESIRRWLRFSEKGRMFVSAIQGRYNLEYEDALDKALWLKTYGIRKKGIKAKHVYGKVFKKRKTWVKRRYDRRIERFTRGIQ